MYDEGIVDTDLMSIINSAWKRSFGRIDKNKNAISDRGWCPLNRALLLDPDILASRSSKERSKQYNRMNGIVFPNKMISDENGTSCGSVVNDSSSTIMSIHNNLPNELNFSSGMSGFCLQSILSEEMLQNARSRINESIDKGKILKDHIKKSKSLSAGIIFKAGQLRLGKTVFDIHKENLREKKRKMNAKIRNCEKTYTANVALAEAVLQRINR